MSAPNIERLCELNVTLSSPLEIDEYLFLVAQNGEIYKLKDGQLKVLLIYQTLLYLNIDRIQIQWSAFLYRNRQSRKKSVRC